MLNLTVTHNIYLTREQRYALHEGEEFDVIGVSLPVWTLNTKTVRAHAHEVFCKYYMSNPRKELPIVILEDGYEISLPFRPGRPVKPLSDDEWRRLSFHNPEALRKWYKQQIHEVSSKNLLDIKDEGSACLSYREHNKIKKEDTMLNIMHFVSIEDMDVLMDSLVTPDNLLEEVQSAS